MGEGEGGRSGLKNQQLVFQRVKYADSGFVFNNCLIL